MSVVQAKLRNESQRRSRKPGKTSYNVGEAKAHLSKILEHVETTGEEVVLTRRGKPVARLIPDTTDNGARQLGFARGEVKLLEGWDEPVTFGEFFAE